MRRISVQTVLLLFLLVSVSPAYGEEKKVEAKSLFEDKCSSCHSIDRPKSKKKTKEGWEKTVMRMKNVNGCPITDDQAKMIIHYLSENYGK